MKGSEALIESSEISWHVVMTHRFDHLHTHLVVQGWSHCSNWGIGTGSFGYCFNGRIIWRLPADMVNICKYHIIYLGFVSTIPGVFFSRISIPSTYHQQLCTINSKVKMIFVFFEAKAQLSKKTLDQIWPWRCFSSHMEQVILYM